MRSTSNLSCTSLDCNVPIVRVMMASMICFSRYSVWVWKTHHNSPIQKKMSCNGVRTRTHMDRSTLRPHDTRVDLWDPPYKTHLMSCPPQKQSYLKKTDKAVPNCRSKRQQWWKETHVSFALRTAFVLVQFLFGKIFRLFFEESPSYHSVLKSFDRFYRESKRLQLDKSYQLQKTTLHPRT